MGRFRHCLLTLLNLAFKIVNLLSLHATLPCFSLLLFEVVVSQGLSIHLYLLFLKIFLFSFFAHKQEVGAPNKELPRFIAHQNFLGFSSSHPAKGKLEKYQDLPPLVLNPLGALGICTYPPHPCPLYCYL